MYLNEYQCKILYLFYKYLKEFIPFTHIKKVKDIEHLHRPNKFNLFDQTNFDHHLRISIDGNGDLTNQNDKLDENEKRCARGYEIMCWIQKSSVKKLDNTEAIELAQIILELKFIKEIHCSKRYKQRKYIFSDIGYYNLIFQEKESVSFDEFHQYLSKVQSLHSYDINKFFLKLFPNDKELEIIISTIESIRNNLPLVIIPLPPPPINNNKLEEKEIEIPTSTNIEIDENLIIPPLIKRNDDNSIKDAREDPHSIIEIPKEIEINHHKYSFENDNIFYKFLNDNYSPGTVVIDCKWITNLPILIFLYTLSTTGLTVLWRYMHRGFNTPRLIYYILSIYATTVWVFSFCSLLVSFTKRGTLQRLFEDKSQVTIFGCISMSFFHLNILAVPLSVTFAKVLFWIGILIQFLSVSLIYAQLIYRIKTKQSLKNSLAPSFIFSASGFLLAATTASEVGYHTIAWMTWGFGSVYCQIYLFIIIISYFVNGIPTRNQLPSQTIFIGYTSLSFMAIVNIQSHLTGLGRTVYLIGWINLGIIVVLWCLMIIFSPGGELYFKLNFWGFGFPVIAFASATVVYYTQDPSHSTKIIALVFVSISNIDYIILLSLTLYHLFTKNLFIPSKVA